MAYDAARAVAQEQAAAADGAGPAPPWSFEALLRELVDEQTYPRLHQIAWSAAIGESRPGFDEREEFLFGVDRILDGAQSLIERVRPERTRRSPTSPRGRSSPTSNETPPRPLPAVIKTTPTEPHARSQIVSMIAGRPWRATRCWRARSPRCNVILERADLQRAGYGRSAARRCTRIVPATRFDSSGGWVYCGQCRR